MNGSKKPGRSKPHTHKVAPVMLQNNRFRSQPVDGPLQWHAPLSAYGKVSNLGLSGAFLVEFTFEEQELRGWLDVKAQ